MTMLVIQRNRKLLVAVVSALLAFILVNTYVGDVNAQAEDSKNAAIKAYGGEVVEIACAKLDILAGDIITEHNVSLRTWSSALLPQGAVTNLSDIVGQTASMPIFTSEPVIAAKVGVSTSDLIVPEGKCAISIPADDVLAVGGAIKPDSHISIYAAGSARVELLADDVQVLATSNSMQGEAAEGLFSSNSKLKLAWVTVAVDPELVSALITSARSYTLYIVLAGSGVNLTEIESSLAMRLEGTPTTAAQTGDVNSQDGDVDKEESYAR